MSSHPGPQPLRLWNTFRPETHRQLAAVWSELLHRQLTTAGGRAREPGNPCHERPLAQGGSSLSGVGGPTRRGCVHLLDRAAD
jgi:hypothetical protein